MQLRWYQEEAVAAVHEHLRTRSDNPCVEIPTGGGKSAVIAAIASNVVSRSSDGQVVVLAHVKELLEQNMNAIRRVSPDLDVGLYSAGLGYRAFANRVVVAGIQSVSRKAYKFPDCQLIIVDEAHLIQPKDNGRYSEFIRAVRRQNAAVQVVGLTATPYRTSSGPICEKNGILNHICYSVGIPRLIADGYLSKLVSKRGLNLDFTGLHMLAGEFVSSEADGLMGSVVNEAVEELLRLTIDRQSCLIFCQSTSHAAAVQARLRNRDATCGYVDGKSADRAATIADFKSGSLKYLVNINVLTTGFDMPSIDCVALLRPTASPGLYYQMVGRGFRTSPGKSNCLVLDFGGNVERHGPVDAITIRTTASAERSREPMAMPCPSCANLIAINSAICPDCSAVLREPVAVTHNGTAGDAPILSESEAVDTNWRRNEHGAMRNAWLAILEEAWAKRSYRPSTNEEFAEMSGLDIDEICQLVNLDILKLNHSGFIHSDSLHYIHKWLWSMRKELRPTVSERKKTLAQQILSKANLHRSGLISPADAAVALGISELEVHHAVAVEQLEVVKVGRVSLQESGYAITAEALADYKSRMLKQVV